MLSSLGWMRFSFTFSFCRIHAVIQCFSVLDRMEQHFEEQSNGLLHLKVLVYLNSKCR